MPLENSLVHTKDHELHMKTAITKAKHETRAPRIWGKSAIVKLL